MQFIQDFNRRNLVLLTYLQVYFFLFLLKGLESIGLKRILDIWELSQGVVSQQPGQQPKCKIYTNAHCIYPEIFLITLFNFPSDIRDPLIRSFAKNPNPFWALKKYMEQTEDKELEGKFIIVEKYGSRIPELVRRLERCFESNFNKAGM